MRTDVEAYIASGAALKHDFDRMIRDILNVLSRHAEQNGGNLTWEYVRVAILDCINDHRRGMAKKYAVLLRDMLALEQAVRDYKSRNSETE